MIDRAATGRSKSCGTADKEQSKKPPLLRHLRDRAPSSVTGAKTAERRQQRAQTIGSVLKSTVSIVLLIWVVLAVLNVVGVNIAPFIASAGVVGLRVTTVRDIDGTLWYVRNGEIARVGNMSQDYAVARIEMPVALTADVAQAERVAVEAAEEALEDPALAAKVLGKPEMLGVQELSPDLLTLRMTQAGHGGCSRSTVTSTSPTPSC